MNLICFDCKSFVDEEFVLPGQVANQGYYRYIALCEGAGPPKTFGTLG
jgi:hypothetical protein